MVTILLFASRAYRGQWFLEFRSARSRGSTGLSTEYSDYIRRLHQAASCFSAGLYYVEGTQTQMLQLPVSC